jgi:hypothetical protein
MADTAEKPADKAPERTPRPPKAKAPGKAPELPELAVIDNNLISLDVNYYFKKRYEDIVEASSELPVIIEYINESLQRASIASSDEKRYVETLEAEAYTRIRGDWTAHSSEKMTEKALEMAIAKDEDLTKAAANYSILRSYVSRLSNMQENLRSKLDMLRSVEATKRKMILDEPTD